MLYPIINNFNRLANSSDPLKLVYNAISYKPFISLFNMTGVAATYPELQGIGQHTYPLNLITH
jgi:prostatic aicd phosphatase